MSFDPGEMSFDPGEAEYIKSGEETTHHQKI
jgi:hypothetical protein